MLIRRVTVAGVSGALALAVGACSAGGPPSGAGDGGGSVVGDQSSSSGLFGGLNGPSGDGTSAGGDSSDSGSGASAADGASSTSPSASSTPAAPITRDVDKSVLFAGFEITVKTATYTPASDQMPAEVTLDIVFANKGSSRGDTEYTAQTFDLASGDHHYQVGGDSDFPTVPGQTQGEGSIVFDVDEHFSLDAAVLTIGSAAQVQSVMPFGSSGTLVDNQPQPANVSGEVTSGPITITITSGELRADLPKALTQAEEGSRYLLLTFDATNHSSRPSPYGDYVTGPSEFTLTQPDGNTISAYDLDDWYGGASSTIVATGKTTHGLLVTFVVATPVKGDYTLTLVGQKDDGSGDAAPGSVDFTLS